MALRLGCEQLFEAENEHIMAVLKGRRVGLITNPTGVDSNLESIVHRFRACKHFQLVALFGPEHGVRGDAQAGETVAKYDDAHLELPVFSLYGQHVVSLAASPLDDIDARMREYDTQHTGKTLEADMLDGVEALVFDLQDIGSRVYTYVSTMAYAMQAAARKGIPFVVLDRPNPLGGIALEGPVLDYPRQSSYIGLYATPCRHSMTVGELASFFNANYMQPPLDSLHVVCMRGWRRAAFYDEFDTAAGAPMRSVFVAPSPNMPTLETAIVYPGMVMLEGTNLSEARGTTRPFEMFGAPFIDGYLLCRDLNALALPGVVFREVYFTPTFSKFVGERCGGCQVHVTDRIAFRSVLTALAILGAVRARYGDALQFFHSYFDHVLGNSSVLERLERGESAVSIAASWAGECAAFEVLRRPFLLYD